MFFQGAQEGGGIHGGCRGAGHDDIIKGAEFCLAKTERFTNQPLDPVAVDRFSNLFPGERQA
jgi:hypothetical protein